MRGVRFADVKFIAENGGRAGVRPRKEFG